MSKLTTYQFVKDVCLSLRGRAGWRLVIAIMIASALLVSCARRRSPATEKVKSFDDFIREVSSARFEDYSSRQGARVANPDEFEKMRKHLLFLYEGVKPEHTFAGTNEIGRASCRERVYVLV